MLFKENGRAEQNYKTFSTAFLIYLVINIQTKMQDSQHHKAEKTCAKPEVDRFYTILQYM